MCLKPISSEFASCKHIEFVCDEMHMRREIFLELQICGTHAHNISWTYLETLTVDLCKISMKFAYRTPSKRNPYSHCLCCACSSSMMMKDPFLPKRIMENTHRTGVHERRQSPQLARSYWTSHRPPPKQRRIYSRATRDVIYIQFKETKTKAITRVSCVRC